MVALPAGLGPGGGTGRSLRLVFHRDAGPDFSERDRALLALLRPHLHQACLYAERRRRGVPRLTFRGRREARSRDYQRQSTKYDPEAVAAQGQD
jgi:hypothetical protein